MQPGALPLAILDAVSIDGRAVALYVLLIDTLSFDGILRKGLLRGTKALIGPPPLMLLGGETLKKLTPLLVIVAGRLLCRAKGCGDTREIMRSTRIVSRRKRQPF